MSAITGTIFEVGWCLRAYPIVVDYLMPRFCFIYMYIYTHASANTLLVNIFLFK